MTEKQMSTQRRRRREDDKIRESLVRLMSQRNIVNYDRVILDCPCHPASWGPIMRKAHTLSGPPSTAFLSPATQCYAGSSAMSSTSCCETDIQTYVKTISLMVTWWLLIPDSYIFMLPLCGRPLLRFCCRSPR